MYRSEKLDLMAAEISANIEQLERGLKEEYKRLFRVSSDFNDIATDFVLLERKTLTQAEKEYETTTIVDRLCARLGMTFGPERDTLFILEAAMAVMDENMSASMTSPN
ncbi:MAG: hypothetical protein KUG69_13865 [Marinosulfonomonas sp.]|nr:hypothetical protein [Marinosulfonomonas sp.]